jgi:hypothetical protein
MKKSKYLRLDQALDAIPRSMKVDQPRGYKRVGRLPKQPIPEGRFLVHNHVIPEATLGLSGFRAFVLDTRKGLVRCTCDFGGVQNADLRARAHKHYRVERGDNALERRAYKAGHAAMLEAMKNPKPSRKKNFFEQHEEMRKRASRASRKVMQGAS